MKPLSITIQPPITEYCRDCDYEASYRFNAYHGLCPNCSGRNISSGGRPHQDKPVSIWKEAGSFNWANPSETQYQYHFSNVPELNNCSFVVDEDLDISDVFETACELKQIFDRYFFSSKKELIGKLFEIMDTEEFAERQRSLEVRDEKEKLERRLFELNQREGIYMEEIGATLEGVN